MQMQVQAASVQEFRDTVEHHYISEACIYLDHLTTKLSLILSDKSLLVWPWKSCIVTNPN